MKLKSSWIYGIKDQERLSKIALNYISTSCRLVAITKIKDQDVLKKIADIYIYGRKRSDLTNFLIFELLHQIEDDSYHYRLLDNHLKGYLSTRMIEEDTEVFYICLDRVDREMKLKFLKNLVIQNPIVLESRWVCEMLNSKVTLKELIDYFIEDKGKDNHQTKKLIDLNKELKSSIDFICD